MIIRKIEMMGPTVDDATKNALMELNLTREQVKIDVIESGSKGILGFNKKAAKILVEEIIEPEKFINQFLKKILLQMNIDVEFNSTMQDKTIFVNLSGPDLNVLIGKHGETLNALQHILNLSLNTDVKSEINVIIDGDNYRKNRKESLEKYAIKMAQKVLKTKTKFKFESMNSYERLLIHNALQSFTEIQSYSEGNGPNRHVVLEYKTGK